MNEEFKLTLTKLNSNIETIQAGKHQKGLGAAAFFEQDTTANAKQQAVYKYYCSEVKLTMQNVDTMRLAIGSLPVDNPLITAHFI